MPNHSVDLSAAGQLLRAAVDIADAAAPLAERRRAMLESLAKAVQADVGHWAWGRGRPESERILAVAIIPFGYTEAQRTAFHQFSLDARVQEDLNRRLQKHLRQHRREDGVWCLNRRDSFSDEEWTPENWIWQSAQRIGWGDWIQAGRFTRDDTFSVVFLGRLPGKPEFDSTHVALVDLAITHIPWLWSDHVEAVPQATIEALSPRQRAVMFMLLDGLSRKKIASSLGIADETVNHHMKAVYQHFHVQSATELAAIFLRSK